MSNTSDFVTAILDRQRPYRVNDSDSDVVWVGPGSVSVPLWVAQEWGLAPKPDKPNETQQPDSNDALQTALADVQRLTAEIERLTAELEAAKQSAVHSEQFELSPAAKAALGDGVIAGTNYAEQPKPKVKK